MRNVAGLCVALSLGACVAGPPALPGASTASAITAAFTQEPAVEPVPLPPLSPSSRRQREIEAMTAPALAQWIFPTRSAEFSTAELYPARWGVLAYALIWREPRSAGPPGICEVSGTGISFRIEGEARLTPQQRLDPPLQPFQTIEERRFRVAGSTEPGTADPECAAGRPYWDWSRAPSAAAIHRAANLMERARARVGARRNPGFSLACSQMRTDERSGASSIVACPDPVALLLQLRPALIQRVRKTACQGDISAVSEGPCIAIEYDDPAAPGTHSFYAVRPPPTAATPARSRSSRE